MAPRAAGERLLTRIRPPLKDVDAFLDSIDPFRDKPAGLRRLTVPLPAASFMLAPLLSRFLARYRAIDLEVSDDAALADIVTGRFDPGMQAGDRIERDMIALRLCGAGDRGGTVGAVAATGVHRVPAVELAGALTRNVPATLPLPGSLTCRFRVYDYGILHSPGG
ncbi:MAG: hypothetical protein WCC64_13165 [Aliidongia sp.]